MHNHCSMQVIQRIEERIARISFLPVENGEGLQVLRYEVRCCTPHGCNFHGPAFRVSVVLIESSDHMCADMSVMCCVQIGEEYKVRDADCVCACWLRFIGRALASLLPGGAQYQLLLSAAAPRLLLGQGQRGPGAWRAAHRHLPHVPVSCALTHVPCHHAQLSA